jgi:hypothetical protein
MRIYGTLWVFFQGYAIRCYGSLMWSYGTFMRFHEVWANQMGDINIFFEGNIPWDI